MKTRQYVFAAGLLIFVILMGMSQVKVYAQLADTMLCGDESCSETISEGKARLAYRPRDDKFLNLKKGDVVLVKSKNAGRNSHLWGGQVMGSYRFGFFPSSFIKEYMVLVKSPKVSVSIQDFLSGRDESTNNEVYSGLVGENQKITIDKTKKVKKDDGDVKRDSGTDGKDEVVVVSKEHMPSRDGEPVTIQDTEQGTPTMERKEAELHSDIPPEEDPKRLKRNAEDGGGEIDHLGQEPRENPDEVDKDNPNSEGGDHRHGEGVNEEYKGSEDHGNGQSHHVLMDTSSKKENEEIPSENLQGVGEEQNGNKVIDPVAIPADLAALLGSDPAGDAAMKVESKDPDQGSTAEGTQDSRLHVNEQNFDASDDSVGDVEKDTPPSQQDNLEKIQETSEKDFQDHHMEEQNANLMNKIIPDQAENGLKTELEMDEKETPESPVENLEKKDDMDEDGSDRELAEVTSIGKESDESKDQVAGSHHQTEEGKSREDAKTLEDKNEVVGRDEKNAGQDENVTSLEKEEENGSDSFRKDEPYENTKEQDSPKQDTVEDTSHLAANDRNNEAKDEAKNQNIRSQNKLYYDDPLEDDFEDDFYGDDDEDEFDDDDDDELEEETLAESTAPISRSSDNVQAIQDKTLDEDKHDDHSLKKDADTSRSETSELHPADTEEQESVNTVQQEALSDVANISPEPDEKELGDHMEKTPIHTDVNNQSEIVQVHSEQKESSGQHLEEGAFNGDQHTEPLKPDQDDGPENNVNAPSGGGSEGTPLPHAPVPDSKSDENNPRIETKDPTQSPDPTDVEERHQAAKHPTESSTGSEKEGNENYEGKNSEENVKIEITESSSQEGVSAEEDMVGEHKESDSHLPERDEQEEGNSQASERNQHDPPATGEVGNTGSDDHSHMKETPSDTNTVATGSDIPGSGSKERPTDSAIITTSESDEESIGSAEPESDSHADDSDILTDANQLQQDAPIQQNNGDKQKDDVLQMEGANVKGSSPTEQEQISKPDEPEHEKYNALHEGEVVDWDEAIDEKPEKKAVGWDEALGDDDDGNDSHVDLPSTEKSVEQEDRLDVDSQKNQSQEEAKDAAEQLSTTIQAAEAMEQVTPRPVLEVPMTTEVVSELSTEEPHKMIPNAQPSEHTKVEIKGAPTVESKFEESDNGMDQTVKESEEFLDSESSTTEDMHVESFWLRLLLVMSSLPFDVFYILEPLFDAWISLLPKEYQNDVYGVSWPIILSTFFVGFALIWLITCRSRSVKRRKKDESSLHTIQELKAQLENLSQEKVSVENELRTKENEVEIQREQMVSASREKDQAATEKRGLEHTLRERNVENEALKRDMQNLNQSLQEKDKAMQDILSDSQQVGKSLLAQQEATARYEAEIRQLQRSLEAHQANVKESEASSEKLKERIKTLEKTKGETKKEGKALRERLDKLNSTNRELQENLNSQIEDTEQKKQEIDVLKDCILQFKGAQEYLTDEGEDAESEDTIERQKERMKSMVDVSNAKATLRQIEADKLQVTYELEQERKSRLDIEAKVSELEASIQSDEAVKNKLEREKQNLESKLTVMQDFYAKREVEIQSKLGLEKSKRENNASLLEDREKQQMDLTQQLEAYKKMSEEAKRNYDDAERQHKQEILGFEKKAHDNWLACREAERKCEEANKQINQLQLELGDVRMRLRGSEREPILRPRPERHGPPGAPPPFGPPRRGPPPPGVPGSPLHFRNGPPPGADRRTPPPLHRRPQSPGGSITGDRPPSRPDRPPSTHSLPPMDRRPPPGYPIGHPYQSTPGRDDRPYRDGMPPVRPPLRDLPPHARPPPGARMPSGPMTSSPYMERSPIPSSQSPGPRSQNFTQSSLHATPPHSTGEGLRNDGYQPPPLGSSGPPPPGSGRGRDEGASNPFRRSKS